MKRLIAIILPLICLLMASVGLAGDQYDEAAAALKPHIPVMEKYLSVVETSSDPKEIAQAMHSLADAMDTLAPKVKELQERYPGIAEERSIPKRYNPLKKQMQQLMQRFTTSYIRVLPFIAHPQVKQANQRILLHLAAIGAAF